MSRFRSFIPLAVWFIAALTAHPVRAGDFGQIVVFGDSTVDTGNLHIALEGLYAASPYFVGRFSNGPVWVEVLAESLELTPPAPSLMGGTNYAWAGAESGDGLSDNGTPNIGLQIDWFLNDHGTLTGDELIVVAVGANDLLWEPPYSPNDIAQNVANQIARLAEAGGRSFLVPTIGLYSDSPLLGGPGEAAWFDALAGNVEKLLDKELTDLKAIYPIDTVRIDVGQVIGNILADPMAFGLTNTADPACPGCGIGLPDSNAADTVVSDPDAYLWWDLAHWTRVVHAAIGELAVALVQ
jgi:3-phytase